MVVDAPLHLAFYASGPDDADGPETAQNGVQLRFALNRRHTANKLRQRMAGARGEPLLAPACHNVRYQLFRAFCWRGAGRVALVWLAAAVGLASRVVAPRGPRNCRRSRLPEERRIRPADVLPSMRQSVLGRLRLLPLYRRSTSRDHRSEVAVEVTGSGHRCPTLLALVRLLAHNFCRGGSRCTHSGQHGQRSRASLQETAALSGSPRSAGAQLKQLSHGR